MRVVAGQTFARAFVVFVLCAACASACVGPSDNNHDLVTAAVAGGATTWDGDVCVLYDAAPAGPSFAGLVNVTGTIAIKHCDHYTGVPDFPDLVSAGGIDIEGNDALVSLHGLRALEHIDDMLSLTNQHLLRDLSGLQSLRTAGRVLVTTLPLLENFETLPALEGAWGLFSTGMTGLTSVAGIERSPGITDFSCQYCGALVDIEPFRAVPGPMKTVFFQHADGVTSLAPLAHIEATEQVVLRNMGGLADVDAFNRQAVLGYVVISHTSAARISGFRNATTAHSVTITYNTGLHGITGFSALVGVGDGGLTIGDNGVLTSIEGLRALRDVDQNVELWGAPLPSLHALSRLENVAGSVRLTSMPGLETLTGLDALATVGTAFSLDTLGSLKNLTGLGALRSCGGAFTVTRCGELVSLTGMGALEVVGGALTLNNNAELRSLDGLGALEAVGGHAELSNVPLLRDISALGNLRHVLGGFSLAGCDVETLHGLHGLEIVGELYFAALPLLRDAFALAFVTDVLGDVAFTGMPLVGTVPLCGVIEGSGAIMAPGIDVAVPPAIFTILHGTRAVPCSDVPVVSPAACLVRGPGLSSDGLHSARTTMREDATDSMWFELVVRTARGATPRDDPRRWTEFVSVRINGELQCCDAEGPSPGDGVVRVDYSPFVGNSVILIDAHVQGESVAGFPHRVFIQRLCAAGESTDASGACARCPADTWSDGSLLGCEACPPRTTVPAGAGTSAEACACVPGAWRSANHTMCVACPRGASCAGGAALPTARGGFSPSASVAVFIECPNPDACVAGGGCSPGYQGRACSECARGFYALGLQCRRCGSGSSAVVALLVVGGLTAACALTWFQTRDDTRVSFVAAIIAWNSLQISALYGRIEIEWGPLAKAWLNAVSLLNLNLDLTSPECSSDALGHPWVFKWALTIATPAIVAVAIAAAGGLVFVAHRATGKTATARFVVGAAARAYGQAITLLYLPMVAMAVGFFGCARDTGGAWYLELAPSLPCYDARYWSLFPLATVMAVAYGAGIPLALVALLRWRRAVESDSTTFRLRYGVFVGRFTDAGYTFEAAILVRKAGVVVAITLARGTRDKAAAAAAWIALTAVWALWQRPYLYTRHNVVAAAALMSCWYVLLGGLIEHHTTRHVCVLAALAVNVVLLVAGNAVDVWKLAVDTKAVEEESFDTAVVMGPIGGRGVSTSVDTVPISFDTADFQDAVALTYTSDSSGM